MQQIGIFQLEANFHLAGKTAYVFGPLQRRHVPRGAEFGDTKLSPGSAKMQNKGN